MLKEMIEKLRTLPRFSLAGSFKRLGWTGFWIQVMVGALPVVLMGYLIVFAQSPSGPRMGLPIVEYLTFADLLLMVFTTFWFYRYTRIGQRIADPALRPAETQLTRAVWIGVVASSLAILFTIIVMFVELGHLLFYFLSAPQAGVPVIQTTGLGPSSWVSAVDMISLLSLVFTLTAEVFVLIFSLWLLFRVMEGSPEYGGAQVQA
ncbi:MAG: DUF3611 family protein [Thiocapsa sp.]|nr:DUF3611 family protein [Thiocapsa sp.]MCG6896365.1 DUF3611 family protein [Thiocapsa sp.]MCG6984985.1 DUF3611 family protein [Thiocapsa sp.]